MSYPNRIFLFVFFLVLSPIMGKAQTLLKKDVNATRTTATQQSGTRQQGPEGMSAQKTKKRERPPIDLYKIISYKNDTTVVDTSLTVQKFYKYNYLKKDRFDLLPFANTGQPHNTLLYNFDNTSVKPLFGARAKHFNYMEVEDINYYEVPTPLTELYYKSVFEQGQTLDAFFTMNTSERFNFSIAYKGLRSLGKYLNILTSTGNFRFTVNARSKNDRYQIKAHYVAQDLLNNENGGLQATAIANFRSNDTEFDDRSRLNVNFENANNILDGQRFYIDHAYDLIDQKDSLVSNRIQIGHKLIYDDKFYTYTQSTPSDVLGNSFVAGQINDRLDLEDFSNEVYVNYANDLLGTLRLSAGHSHYDYGYNSVLIREDNERIPNRLQGNIIEVGAGYMKTIGGFKLEGQAKANIAGDFDGYDFNGAASFRFRDLFDVKARIHSNSSLPNYNHLLYQNSYENYNWYHLDDYKNVKTNTLGFDLKSNKLVNVTANLTTISDYAYFGLNPNDSLVNTYQTSDMINYLNIKANKEFRFGKFALNNTIAYQKVFNGQDYLQVPELITRNTLYYTDEWFDKALFIQTGVNFKYFTSYFMNGYDPVLSEFYVQADEKFGEFPLIDVFFNMKVRQTRIFFIAEHVNSPFTGNDFFSAPGYPYRDFNVRFGIVWNLFL
ncbi:MAG: hypothetical protein CL868_10595 [Cytophagaceae bacterium]|nr:hypothetical protein [Cytophagaceae bacterium]